jgi:hypothetical protein
LIRISSESRSIASRNVVREQHGSEAFLPPRHRASHAGKSGERLFVPDARSKRKNAVARPLTNRRASEHCVAGYCSPPPSTPSPRTKRWPNGCVDRCGRDSQLVSHQRSHRNGRQRMPRLSLARRNLSPTFLYWKLGRLNRGGKSCGGPESRFGACAPFTRERHARLSQPPIKRGHERVTRLQCRSRPGSALAFGR